MNGMQELIDEMRLALVRTSEGLTPAMGDLLTRMEARNTGVDEQLQKLAEARAEAVDDSAEYRKSLEALMHLTEPDAKPWLSEADFVTMVHTDCAKALASSEAGRKLRNEVREIERMVCGFEEKVQWFRGSDPLSKRIDAVINHYIRQAANAVSAEKNSRDNILTYLRAMVISAEAAYSGGTHYEKAARLRGVIEVIEGAITKLQSYRVDFYNGYWRDHEDIFRSDYPVKEYIHKIHQLEAEVKQLQKEQKPEAEEAG